MLTHFVTNSTFLSDPLVDHGNVRLEAGPEQKKTKLKKIYHLNLSDHLVVKTFPQ